LAILYICKYALPYAQVQAKQPKTQGAALSAAPRVFFGFNSDGATYKIKLTSTWQTL
jgi:hypothetical protein